MDCAAKLGGLSSKDLPLRRVLMFIPFRTLPTRLFWWQNSRGPVATKCSAAFSTWTGPAPLSSGSPSCHPPRRVKRRGRLCLPPGAMSRRFSRQQLEGPAATTADDGPAAANGARDAADDPHPRWLSGDDDATAIIDWATP